jgi:hypothetical protein
VTRDQINQQLRQTQVDIVLASRRYDAAKSQFDAACFVGDGEEAQRHRDSLHATLDTMLDSTAAVMSLTRQLMLTP